MSRNGSGVYSLPPGSTVTNGDTSDATDVNTPLVDLASDANVALSALHVTCDSHRTATPRTSHHRPSWKLSARMSHR